MSCNYGTGRVTDYPLVICLVITYRRLELARAEIRSIKEHLDYPHIGWHIADDGSGMDYIKALCKEIGKDYEITYTDASRGGVGLNMNMGMEAALSRSDYWLHLEDDWVLRQTLDLKPCVELLQGYNDIGMVRLGRLTPGLTGVTVSGANRLWWWLKRGSDTYVFSGNAALRHRRFWEAYGDYPTGLTPGRTELAMCDRFARTDGPAIVWPAWLNTDEAFHHIGDSQSFKYYMESEGLTAEEAVARWESQ